MIEEFKSLAGGGGKEGDKREWEEEKNRGVGEVGEEEQRNKKQPVFLMGFFWVGRADGLIYIGVLFDLYQVLIFFDLQKNRLLDMCYEFHGGGR